MIFSTRDKSKETKGRDLKKIAADFYTHTSVKLRVSFKGVLIVITFPPPVFEVRSNKTLFHLLILHLPIHLKETISEYFWLYLWKQQNWKMAIYHSMYASIYCNICSISHSQKGNNKHCHIFNSYQWFNPQFLVSSTDCALQCFITLIFAGVKHTTQKSSKGISVLGVH